MSGSAIAASTAGSLLCRVKALNLVPFSLRQLLQIKVEVRLSQSNALRDALHGGCIVNALDLVSRKIPVQYVAQHSAAPTQSVSNCCQLFLVELLGSIHVLGSRRITSYLSHPAPLASSMKELVAYCASYT